MRAHQGKLGLGPGPGEEVFAASFLREREIVLDEELLRHAPDLVRIFAHELYHFVWRRLPNSERAAWAEVLKQEQVPLHPDLSSRLAFDRYRDKPTEANWKHYVCEAFCDSASSFASPDALLRSNRKRWLASLMKRRPLAV
ncbi:MAG: hypothetical protein NW208_06060 [Bryobacter sp.]|nr:hypothetical protein [Bryobacter sp.]